MDAVAVTPRHQSALRRIRRHSGVTSVASLMAFTVHDLLDWPGASDQNVKDILTLLDRVRRSPDPGNVGGSLSREPSSRGTRIPSHAPLAADRRDAAIDPFAGRLGDVFPSLSYLADVDLRSDWLDECASASGKGRALAYLRSRHVDSATIGELLTLDIGDVAPSPRANPVLAGGILDFLSQLAAEAYETRESAIATVASWIASTSGRATWSNIVTLGFNTKPPEVQRAWKTLAAMPISDRPVPHATSVITEFVAELSELDRAILVDRMIAHESRTTEEIADQFAMSTKAVRNRELALEQLIRSELVRRESWRPVGWACQAYRHHDAPKILDERTSGSCAADLIIARRFIAWLCDAGLSPQRE
jgi:hypothetical protein